MPYPTLAANSTWYKSTQPRSTITQINIVDNYTPTGNENETWNADTGNTGSIKCYRTGTVLTIAGNGTGKIYANADSSCMFGGSTSALRFTAVTKITGLGLLDTSRATTLLYAFLYCTSLTSVDVTGWDTRNVTTISSIFNRCSKLATITGLGTWDTGNMENIGGAFRFTVVTDLSDISGWDTSSCKDMSSTFATCNGLKELDLSRWDTGCCENMLGMFQASSSLTTIGDVSNWDVSKVTDMQYMFAGCTSLAALDVSNWDVSKVANMNHMFASGSDYGTVKCQLAELDVSAWNPASCTDMSFMFYGLNGLTKPLDVSGWDVSKVTNFDHMTAHSHITFIGVENWVTPVATNMNAMFHSIANTKIDVSKLDTKNVLYFCQMFDSSTALAEIAGLENFDTTAGLGFDEMFNGCRSLKRLNLSSFDTSKAKDGVSASSNGHTTKTLMNMFAGTTALYRVDLGEKFSVDGDGTTTDATHHAILPTTASGSWYDIDKVAYAPSAIPDGAGTYFASTSAVDEADAEMMFVSQGSLLRTAKAIREKAGTAVRYAPSEFAAAISALT